MQEQEAPQRAGLAERGWQEGALPVRPSVHPSVPGLPRAPFPPAPAAGQRQAAPKLFAPEQRSERYASVT